ncbi:MAG: hypothetical protein RI897_963 [Verrucomicrobiota bacterium]|jgi:intracellular sulfur oxidation DsrE/DsrF family protein
MSTSPTYRRTLLLAVANTDPRVAPALDWVEHHLHQKPNTRLYAYCIAEGVTWLNHPSLQKLKYQGLRVFACAKSACDHNLPVDNQAIFGGLGLLTDLLLATDQFISLCPGSDHPWTPPTNPVPTPPPPQPRLVQISIQHPESEPENAAEALRIATALLAEDRLLIQTSCPQLTLKKWLEICQHRDQIAALPQNWQAFTEAHGTLLTQDSPPLPPHQYPAFAAIPF